MGPFGCQWFSLQDRRPEVIRGVRATAPILDAFIDDQVAAHGSRTRVALLGFSQGTMMSLYVGLRRARPLAGILGFSGALVGADLLGAEIRSRPPALLVHGDADDVALVEAMFLGRRGPGRRSACWSARPMRPACCTASTPRASAAVATCCSELLLATARCVGR